MTAFEPGTVAVIKWGDESEERAIRVPGGWSLSSDWASFLRSVDVSDVRPLVVLDHSHIGDALSGLHRILKSDLPMLPDEVHALRELADQIEAQARPPKPPEPTGLGAVVEDTRGIRWTRVEAGSQAFTRNPWHPSDCDDQPAEWSEIAAVRVLSEGVSGD